LREVQALRRNQLWALRHSLLPGIDARECQDGDKPGNWSQGATRFRLQSLPQRQRRQLRQVRAAPDSLVAVLEASVIRGKSWTDGWLTAYWGKESRRDYRKDLVFGSPCKPDGHLLYGALCFTEVTGGKSLVQELEARGYDITTLQFSVKRKYRPNEKPSAPQAGGRP
jgi:hypothetical protein